jgi:hypothetical protein
MTRPRGKMLRKLRRFVELWQNSGNRRENGKHEIRFLISACRPALDSHKRHKKKPVQHLCFTGFVFSKRLKSKLLNF